MPNIDEIFTDSNKRIPIDIEKLNNFTGNNIWNAVYTVQLGELIEVGLFDWTMQELDWKEAAYNEEQYERFCAYFVERFRFREISIEPFYEWATMLKRKLVYELMPKYIPMYQRIEDGFNPLQTEDEYYKRRTIGSDYPETLLSGNADYISDGEDEEYERIKEGKLVDALDDFVSKFRSVDALICDELESMFIGLYTMNANAF